MCDHDMMARLLKCHKFSSNSETYGKKYGVGWSPSETPTS